MSEALHLYCVIGAEGERNFGPIGIGGRRVYTVHYQDMAAVVSPSPIRAYKSMKKEEVIPYLFTHQTVIEKVMEAHTVVPVKFGTMARDAEDVRKILTTGYPQMRTALEAMWGKIELDVVALWRELDSILREIGEEEEIRRLKEVVAGRPPGETIEERVQVGKMVKARLDQRREALGAGIVEALKPLTEDLCPHPLPDDRMILNMAFLLDRDRESDVSETLERLNGRYGESIDFRCVGPLPPYSFGTVEVRRFDFGEIDRARRLLGLGEWATLVDIKEAYRRLAHQCHPDKHHATQRAEGAFEEVTEAYRLLADYCQVGGRTFQERDVGEAIFVSLLQWPREVGVA
jgi:hypothetical protein